MNYSEKLVMLRKLRSLTQQELADAIPVSLKTLQRIENGSAQLTQLMEERIVNALKLTKEEFERFEVTEVFNGLKKGTNKVKKKGNIDISPEYISYLESTFLEVNRENIFLKLKLQFAQEETSDKDGKTNLFHS